VEPSAPLAERVAFYRRRRGLSQARLAGLIGRSESWVSQVERGVRSIDRISVLNQLAAALHVSVLDLAPTAVTSDEPDESPAVAALRAALIGQPWLRLAVDDDPPPVSRADLEVLALEVVRSWTLVHEASYMALSEGLPGLLHTTERAARRLTGADALSAAALAAEVYQLLAAALAKLGEPDMGWLAADRAIRAAEMANDPVLAVAGLFRLAHVFLSARRLDEARDVVELAIASLEPMMDDCAAEVWSLWGALNLVAAVIATRRGDTRTALDALNKARGAADRVGTERNDFHTEFGPANVVLHAVSIAVELGDAGEALRLAATIDASHLSPERRARFLLDVARAHGQRKQTPEAIRALLEAERLTPEQIRSHILARELIRDLLRREGREVSADLQGLARRASVLP
jgi:transcriptional regulator with XRE-family HTH domain